jgi:hypothetical protein
MTFPRAIGHHVSPGRILCAAQGAPLGFAAGGIIIQQRPEPEVNYRTRVELSNYS